jgi:hypothetical protein
MNLDISIFDFALDTFRQLHGLAKLDCRLGRLGESFKHIFIIGDQRLEAGAILRAREVRHNAGEA